MLAGTYLMIAFVECLEASVLQMHLRFAHDIIVLTIDALLLQSHLSLLFISKQIFANDKELNLVAVDDFLKLIDDDLHCL